MQGIDAVYGDVPFERNQDVRKVLQQALLGSAALAAAAVVALALRDHAPSAPEVVATSPAARPAPPPAAAPESAANEFGQMVIEPEWVKKSATQTAALIPLPSLEPFPAPETQPRPELAPSASATAGVLPDTIPLPPVRDFAREDENFPLPPPRPPEFATAPVGRAPERSAALPPPPGESRNFFQKLFGLGAPSTPAPERAGPAVTVASAPPAAYASSTASPPAVPASASQGRGGFGGLSAIFNRTLSFDRLGYDRYTAVYDISARTVYLPDGTKLEAHSGLGDRLDDPRHVDERARGATPPHLYELTLREGSFHGVQAIRLNPVGEGGIYGRAGLLAHPYMLGPNGDSNGCVSFKDYAAFLRAYESGEIKRLAVVAQL